MFTAEWMEEYIRAGSSAWMGGREKPAEKEKKQVLSVVAVGDSDSAGGGSVIQVGYLF